MAKEITPTGFDAAAVLDQWKTARPIDFEALGLGDLSKPAAVGEWPPLRASLTDALARLSPISPGIGKGIWGRTPELFSRLARVEQELEASDPNCARLSVLLDKVGVGHALTLMERMVSEGAQPLIDILGEILLEPETLSKFAEVVRKADLPYHAEKDLLHALGHLSEGEPDDAFPSFVSGLEGAFRHEVRRRGDRKKRPNARALAVALGMEKEHELLVAAIYDHANDGRHGAELNRRDACVLISVGLVLWMTECCEQPAMDWLGRELNQRLSAPALVVA
jgi:hypothetical protein